jgi:quinone-modifying oxidoreductase, subunit QmoA
VFLVERGPSLGGRVARLYEYFPKLCPPACGLEINYQRIRKNHNKIKVLTLAEVKSLTGSEGAFEAELTIHPRYVNEKCTTCGDCTEACTVERKNDHNYGMDSTKAIYRPYETSFPQRYAIDMEGHTKQDFAPCVEACKYDAIDLDMAPVDMKIQIGAVVVATGWDPYDASRIDNLGGGQFDNVITNVMMERLAAPNGPTNGKILRPSDGEPAKNVVFVHCAGSRDVNHLSYCSGVCCLASLKQARYLREKDPEAQANLFYIDLRARGIYEDFLTATEADEKIILRKGKVAKIEEDAATKNLTIAAEDILGGGKMTMEADLVVLATGMVPSTQSQPLPFDIRCDDYGFGAPNEMQPAGIIIAGTAKGPTDVATAIQDATGAAIKAIHSTRQA